MALGSGMENGLVVGAGMGLSAVVGLGVDGMQPMMLYMENLRCLKVGDSGKWRVGSV